MGGNGCFRTEPTACLQTLAGAIRRKQCPSSTHSITLAMRIDEITNTSPKPAKPLTPDQARVENLKQQKERASDALKKERDRQKVAKARQQISSVVTPHL